MNDISATVSGAVTEQGVKPEEAQGFADNLIEWLAVNGYAVVKLPAATNRIYRVLGTDKDGISVQVSQPTAESAQRAVADANRRAAGRGQSQDWRAEYADLEWKPLADREVREK